MENISLEEIKEQIQVLQEQRNQLLEEKQSIEETDILKRYFELNREIIIIDKDITNKEKEKFKITYNLCNHDLLFLETYCVRRKCYYPKFKCIDCGKRITGAIRPYQIVINENYTDFNEGTYIGDLKDYKKICKLYSEYKEQGLEKMQIAILLEGHLHDKYQKTKSVLNLVRK